MRQIERSRGVASANQSSRLPVGQPRNWNKKEPYEYELDEADKETVRRMEYAKMQLSVHTYRYPKRTYLSVELKGQPVRILSPFISGQSIRQVQHRVDNITSEYPGCIISINNPSKIK